MQSETLPHSRDLSRLQIIRQISGQISRFKISDAGCRAHNLNLDPDFRFQISDLWARIYPWTRFPVRFQISGFTWTRRLATDHPRAQQDGPSLTNLISAICTSTRQGERSRADHSLQILDVPELSLDRTLDLRRAHTVSKFQFTDFRASWILSSREYSHSRICGGIFRRIY